MSNSKAACTGCFRFSIERLVRDVVPIDFVDGQTESRLSPPAGDHGSRCELISNTKKGKATGAASVSTRLVAGHGCDEAEWQATTGCLPSHRETALRRSRSAITPLALGA